MSTDYTDLSWACPKDAYPLPNIDRLVDEVVDHKILGLLDAYSNYNHIRMDLADENKTDFITELTNYSYKVIPFRLKNFGVTY